MPKYRFLALSDTHSPSTDEQAFGRVVSAIETYKPDVIVHLGDAIEGDFMSKHPPDAREEPSPDEELDKVVAMLNVLTDAAPNAHKVWLYGNHDDSMLNYQPGRRDTKTYKLIRAYWREVRKGIRGNWHIISTYKHSTAWRLGQITFRHGSDTSDAGAKQDLFDYCTPHGLHISGHTHRPQEVQQLVMGKSLTHFWSANTGCLADVERLHYMDRKRNSLWGHAYVIGECLAPNLNEGRKVYAQKNWDAETVILRRFGENWAPNSLSKPA